MRSFVALTEGLSSFGLGNTFWDNLSPYDRKDFIVWLLTEEYPGNRSEEETIGAVVDICEYPYKFERDFEKFEAARSGQSPDELDAL